MQPWAWPALRALLCEQAHRSVHSPQQPGILAMKETAGGQRPPSTLLTAAALYFYHGIAFIYQYFCFSNKLMETMCQLNCLLIIPGTWAHQCFICNSLAMLIKYLNLINTYRNQVSQQLFFSSPGTTRSPPCLQCCLLVRTASSGTTI